MREGLINYLGGYVKVRLEGYSPERFLNLCCARCLKIWEIQCIQGHYEFYMALNSFRQVQPLVRKSGVRLRILEKQGLPFFLYRNRKRKLFGAGLACFFGILYALSLFLWDVEIQGNYFYTYDTLMDWLKSQEITYGMPKNQVDCQGLEARLRSSFPEITWVSARISGTRLLIQIKENQVLSEIPDQQEIPCDIVAAQDGTITSMIVRRGTPAVSPGDLVEEGQLLVLGAIDLLDDSKTKIKTYYVPADADVEARMEISYEKEISLLHRVRVPSGRSRTGFRLQIGNWSALFMAPEPENTTWDYVSQRRQLKIFTNFYLPVWLEIIEGEEMSQYQRLYTDQELEEISNGISSRFAENLEEKGVQILENNDRIERSASSCRLSGTLTVVAPVGKKVPREDARLNQELEENIATE